MPTKMDENIYYEKQRNVVQMYALVNELLLDEKYCDVTILIGNQSFKSSRLLLAGLFEFFDVMFFGSNFAERNLNKSEPIELHNVDALTFKEILQFMQSGHIRITNKNVCSLLLTSDFLGSRISSIEEQCTTYLRHCIYGTKPVLNAFEILQFAFVTKKVFLVDIMTRYICKNFDDFAKDDQFLNISFDELNLLLRNRYSHCIDDIKLLNAIFRWISHSCEERKKYRPFLMENIDLTTLSERQHLTFMFNKYKNFVDQFTSNETADADHVNATNLSNDYRYSNYLETHDHFYVFAAHGTKNQTGVFSVGLDENGTHYTFKLEVVIPSKAISRQSITVRDTIYCLRYNNMNAAGNQNQIFSACKSVDATPVYSVLTNPPHVLSCFNICGFQNSIYAYDTDKYNSSQGTSYNEFSHEERSRGIFVYHCELGKWFPVPPMKDRVFNSCMTIDNNVLYLIGGQLSFDDRDYRYMQTYDYRMKIWNKISIPGSNNKSFIKSACCVHQKKIYVCEGGQFTSVNVYDPVGGWMSSMWNANDESLGSGNSIKLASWKNKLWMFSTRENMNVGVFKVSPNSTIIRTYFAFSLRQNFVNKEYSHFTDCLVF